MKTYMGFNIVQAEARRINAVDGYDIINSDGTKYWVPADILNKTYMEIGENNTITQEMVDSFIIDTKVISIDNKTTIVHAELKNGFRITKSSSCVDPANYDEEVGKEICMEHIKNEIWAFLGFLLSTALNGTKSE